MIDDDVLALESEPPSLRQQVPGLRPDDAAFGLARNRHTAASAKLEHAVISEDAKRPQHGVGVDAQDGGHVAGRRQALTRTDVAVCDVTTDLGGDLVVQGHAVVSVELDIAHGDKHSVTIVSGTRTAQRRIRLPTSSITSWSSAKHDGVSAGGGSSIAVVVVGGRSCGGDRRPGRPRLDAQTPLRSTRTGPQGHAGRATTPASFLERPTSLAIGPNKNLYIADDMRDQVLERLPDGTFEPVAGNGTVGFSGDGGPATSAQLNYPSGITFGPDGTLYIADYGNGRIRAVSSAGIITTIAGSGGQGAWVADGTPALEASLRPTAMAFGPEALMYVADDQEVLRLEPNGTFTRVLGENANEYAGRLRHRWTSTECLRGRRQRGGARQPPGTCTWRDPTPRPS